MHQRSLFLVGHTPGSGVVLDDDVRSAFLPSLSEGFVLRKEEIAMANFTPIFATFTEEDIAHVEKEREKDSKRKKRATRARRGIVLPDREPQKTHRTPINVVGPNGVVPTQVDSVPVPVTTSRRAAAIAAQANINLLAQDLPIPQPPSPVPMPSTNRGRKPGRPPRATSRTSPTPGRQNSIAYLADGDTPMTGAKRSFREDSASEASSPLPVKKRSNARITSPEVIAEEPELHPESKRFGESVSGALSGKPLRSGTSTANGNIGWRCQNCGVPEHLAGGICKDQTGQQTLCGTCCVLFSLAVTA